MTHIVTIGGTDPSGGAGLTRDAAMAARMGAATKPVVTAVTVQTGQAVQAINPVEADTLRAQLRAALAAPRPAAIKIGIVASAEQIDVLVTELPAQIPIVLDPVLRASSGGMLSAREALLPLVARVTLLTPNLPESAALTGRTIAATDADLQHQGEAFLAVGCRAVLIKGGHAGGPRSTDTLIRPEGVARFDATRMPGARRGTGCSLATGIACGLALGRDLQTACQAAKTEITNWLASSDPV
ncbi:hydroxymethylpyrimidine/phosphomethylpyrimidine kinase [Phaeobacter sp. B1627]|uniref:bifunctional hydroxymethylpyrimidine kinase/phosphomethylpyrimidine kinase n=1 Tax=Phaeobacter sp. B1627 TaxID=2583809 RepID=UPI001118DB9A|nr:hydroxymethylpyrimidine/phosphomethylpyrimidine kinase [Phaeobacter sp. B1627]TNJ40562.1 hydroxymethylpyrimidine/phosphomethylpyrimidine kinase [Phaeobacter sp. B1627]